MTRMRLSQALREKRRRTASRRSNPQRRRRRCLLQPMRTHVEFLCAAQTRSTPPSCFIGTDQPSAT